MANFTWKNPSGGSWTDPAQWTNDASATPSAPTPTDQAFITLASGTISATGVAYGAVTFNDPGATLTWLPNVGTTLADLRGVFTLTSGTIALGNDAFNFGDVGIGNFYNVIGSGTLVDNSTVILDQNKLSFGTANQTIAFTPAITIGGSFTTANATAVSFQGAVTVNASGTLDIESDGSNVLSVANAITNAGNVIVGNGATLEVKSTFANSAGGVVTVTGFGSMLLVDQFTSVTDTGTIRLSDEGQLSVTTLSAPSGTITFTDASASLLNITTRNDYPAFTANISGFRAGNAINFSGFAYSGTDTTMALTGNTLRVTNAGQLIGTLTFDNIASLHLALGSDNSFALANAASGILLTTAACFAPGTGILTTRGRIAIEDIRIGCEIETARGLRRVIWTGRRHVVMAHHPTQEDVQPVRVQAGAFGPGSPARDVVLSPDHAVHTDLTPGGALIPVRHLLNGTSIIQESVRAITWHHLELDRHDVVLAEGLAVESYLDTGNRHDFEGGDILVFNPAFAGSDAGIAGSPSPCAPFQRQGPVVEAVRTLLARIAAEQDRKAA